MKAIKCELCGSNDIIKQDGVFVCQYCGTKYSTEEAKKMMVEGVVEVQGTVKVDDTSKQSNLKKLAERAFADKIYKDAYDYYEKMLELNADDWEAVYKKGICAAWQSTLANPRLSEAMKASKTAFNIILKENDKKDNDFLEEIKIQMADEINSVATSFYFTAQNHYNEFWKLKNSASEYWVHLANCINAEEYAVSLLSISMVEKNPKAKNLYLAILKNCIVYYCEICKKRRFQSGYNQYGETYSQVWYRNDLRGPIVDKYNTTVQAINRYEPNYIPEKIEAVAKGGCYVATAVYGSYDCPEVWTLRRYRDNVLDATWHGRIFIKCYYAISPIIVRKFGKTKIFNKVWRKVLNNFVRKLQIKGIASTPYNDKY